MTAHRAVRALLAVLLAAASGVTVPRAQAAPPTLDAAHTYDVQNLVVEGRAGTALETFHELLPRPLPTRMTGAEIIEFRRRVKNLALFDAVDVAPLGTELRVRLQHKTTIAPIVDFSTGKTLTDTKVTLGAVEHDVDGHGTRLGGKASYSDRGLNFAVWLQQHPFRPRRWAMETEVYYAGSGFRFEGAGADARWHRNRLGGEIEALSPSWYRTKFRYEFKINAYREQLTSDSGVAPPDGTYLGTASEFTYDRYTFHDLTPSGFRGIVELRPGVFLGAAQPRHELRLKAKGAIAFGELTGLVAYASASVVNRGNPNHSALLGSQQGVRGLPDALYRNQAQAFANVELRHALPLGKRWYLQGVAFGDAATFRPMDAQGRATDWQGALSTGLGLRLLPTALVDTLLRVDGSRLHHPFGAWFVQFGISQYI
jgi:hypothetical protein